MASRPRARDFRDLLVWQRAKQLVRESYAIARALPDSERYGLSAQIQRAAVSVVANIAEGWGRATRRELRRFLTIARGSLYELDCLFDLTEELGMMQAGALHAARESATQTGRMLTALRSSLRRPQQHRGRMTDSPRS